MLQLGYLFDHPGTVFFSIFMSFWSISFLEYWKRTMFTLAHHWDCMEFQEDEVSRSFICFDRKYRHAAARSVWFSGVACLTRTSLRKPERTRTRDVTPIACVLPSGASSARVRSHGHDDGAEPGHGGERALLPSEDANVSHADRLHGHHHDGQFTSADITKADGNAGDLNNGDGRVAFVPPLSCAW